jgi:Xaa-Pro aminopeptidase
MSDVLVIGDPARSPELRHEVPLGVLDPFVYLERDGARHVYAPAMEVDRIRGVAPDATVHPLEEIGIDELYAQDLTLLELRLEWAARACAHAGLARAAVPAGFPGAHLDRLRHAGIELAVDQSLFDERRRVKAGPELDGIRRAQRAAEAGLAAGLALLRESENGDGVLWLEGEPLTVERVKAAMRGVFAEQGCTAEDFIVAPGPQGACGHEMGHGPIRFGEPIVFDLWPQDNVSSCFADMTRTFVVGPVSDQVHEWHTLTKEALDTSKGHMRAGVRCHDVFAAACEVYEAAGYPTQRTKADGEVLDHGFFHGLGHGVGLEVHEAPYMGRLPGGALVAGDVVTVEPGLYDPAVGGVRLEDLVLVTEDGCEVLTRFPYDLEVPAA